MGKSTNSMVIFNSKLLVHQRVHPIELCLHLPLPRRCRLHGSGALVADHALAELEVSVYPAGSLTVLVMLVATAWGK